MYGCVFVSFSSYDHYSAIGVAVQAEVVASAERAMRRFLPFAMDMEDGLGFDTQPEDTERERCCLAVSHVIQFHWKHGRWTPVWITERPLAIWKDLWRGVIVQMQAPGIHRRRQQLRKKRLPTARQRRSGRC